MDWRISMLNRNSRVFLTLALTLGILFLTGCPPSTTIENINRDPGRYAGKDVTIHGQVSDSFGALGNGLFQIDDGTGRMWVVSQNFGVPGNGCRVSVTRRSEQGFSFGGRSIGDVMGGYKARH